MSLTKVHGKVLPLQKSVNWATPEQFGAIGDGVNDDTNAWQLAVNTGLDIRASGSATYFISTPILFPYMTGYQHINGGYCTIVTTGNYSPFGQILQDGSTSTTTIRKNFENFISKGFAGADASWLPTTGSIFLSFSYGYVRNVTATGHSNALRAFGYTYAENIHGDDLRNALWSCYDPGHNTIVNSSCGWCSGDGIIIKGEYNIASNLMFESAGVISPNNADGANAVKGVVVSAGADGYPANYAQISNITCKYFGAGAVNLNGDSMTLGGSLNFGDIDNTNYIAARSTSAIWLNTTNSFIGDIKLGEVFAGVGINAHTSNTRIGTVDIKSKKAVSGSTLISVGDTPENQIVNVDIEAIIFHGQSTINDDVYINTAGVKIGKIYIYALNNQQGGNTVNIAKACRIDEMYLQATTSAATNNNIYIQDNASIGKLYVIRSFGVPITVKSGAVPFIGDIYILNKFGTLPPIKILGDGTQSFSWGNVIITGTSVTRPTLTGTLSMASYKGPAWATGNSSLTSTVSFPVSTSTDLNV